MLAIFTENRDEGKGIRPQVSKMVDRRQLSSSMNGLSLIPGRTFV